MGKPFKRGDYYYVQVWEHIGGGNRRRKQIALGTTDAKTAEIVARRVEREYADPDHARQAKASIADAVRLFLNENAGRVAAARMAAETASFYAKKIGHVMRILEGVETPHPQPFPLAALRARDVDAYIATRRGEGAADATIGKELTAWRIAMKLAKRAEIWKGDIDAVFPVRFAPGYKPRTRWLPPDELSGLISHLHPGKAARVAFIVATSACWSESNRAQRVDANMIDGMVYIRGTKREQRKRTVPIVTDWQRVLLTFALYNGTHEGAVLFAPWTNVRHDLEAACKRAGIARCSPNDLRRSHAQWLRQDGVPLELVAPMMGHKGVRMVATVYGVLGPAELAARLKACTAHAAGVPGPSSPSGPPGAQQGDVSQQNDVNSVPRDGIEPPTRGFSILDKLSLKPREKPSNSGQFGARAAHMHRKPE